MDHDRPRQPQERADQGGGPVLPDGRPAGALHPLRVGGGPVVETVTATEDDLREITARYLPAEKVDGYVAFASANHGEQVIVRMRLERWVSSDLGSV